MYSSGAELGCCHGRLCLLYCYNGVRPPTGGSCYRTRSRDATLGINATKHLNSPQLLLQPQLLHRSDKDEEVNDRIGISLAAAVEVGDSNLVIKVLSFLLGLQPTEFMLSFVNFRPLAK